MSNLKSSVKKILPEWMIKRIVKAKDFFFDGYALKSYSQEGEDIILRRIFERKKIGFYVDVGAYHPKRFSNTYFFYKRGWRGINVDAMPGSMIPFKRIRPRDINLEVPISSSNQTLTYYIFNEPGLSGFSKELSIERDSNNNDYKIIRTIEMKTHTLEKVLEKYLPRNQLIDFMSIDVEGLDYEVLISNNWTRFKPQVVLVEVLEKSFEELRKHEITQFMQYKGYSLYAKCGRTVFYMDLAVNK